ncbi:unnamed protein product, partial [Ectocarpus sp. 8 AP-2014]
PFGRPPEPAVVTAAAAAAAAVVCPPVQQGVRGCLYPDEAAAPVHQPGRPRGIPRPLFLRSHLRRVRLLQLHLSHELVHHGHAPLGVVLPRVRGGLRVGRVSPSVVVGVAARAGGSGCGGGVGAVAAAPDPRAVDAGAPRHAGPVQEGVVHLAAPRPGRAFLEERRGAVTVAVVLLLLLLLEVGVMAHRVPQEVGLRRRHRPPPSHAVAQAHVARPARQ